MKTGRNGFTMIEIILVLILMAITGTYILSQATPGSAELVAQVGLLKSHLRFAQIKAMSDTVPWGIHIPDSSSYVLYKNNAQATVTLLPGENGQTHTLPAGITITAGTGVTYNFNAWGTPVDAAGASVTAEQTITLSQGSDSSKIAITKNTGYTP